MAKFMKQAASRIFSNNAVCLQTNKCLDFNQIQLACFKRFFNVCINFKIEDLYSSQYGHYNQHWSALVSRGSDGG